ncbi:hypothetical protein D3C72_2529300 [compost metagenome]
MRATNLAIAGDETGRIVVGFTNDLRVTDGRRGIGSEIKRALGGIDEDVTGGDQSVRLSHIGQ